MKYIKESEPEENTIEAQHTRIGDIYRHIAGVADMMRIHGPVCAQMGFCYFLGLEGSSLGKVLGYYEYSRFVHVGKAEIKLIRGRL